MRRNVTADMIRQAILRRHLEEIQHAELARGQEQHQHVINNLYGGGGGMSGVREQMDPDDNDYFVKITRRDLDEKDPDTGKPVGWEKKVHRYRQPHDEKKK